MRNFGFQIPDFRFAVLVAGVAGVAICGLALNPRGPEGIARAQEKKLEPAPGSSKVDPLTEIQVVERVRRATAHGLEYLRSKQQPDGSWHRNNAVNALAMLAFLGRGHTPGRGPYRDVLQRGKKFLLASAQPNGYVSFSTMYEHGLATLCLAEMYGMDPDPDVEVKLRKAVELIIKCQSPAGGWRYAPTPGDQDLSVTVMQIVALRAANNADIPVPEQTIQKAIHYVRSCANPGGGGYGYGGPGSGPQTSAAGVLSLQLLGQYNDPHIPKTLDYVATIPILWGPGGPQYFYYFHYYAVQANYQAGGKYWDNWHPRIRDLLLSKQNPDGSWDVPPGTAEGENVVGPNKVYWTAMGCLVLDIYMHFLPAYQR